MTKQHDNPEVELQDKEVLALDDLIRNPEKRAALFKEAKRFALELDEHARRGKNLNADIKVVAEEVFGVKAGTFKEFIGDVYSLEKTIALLTAKLDVLEVLKEERQKNENK